MHPDMKFHLRILSRVVYYVTDEEDRFLQELHETLHLRPTKKPERKTETFVFNAAFGMVPLAQLIEDWSTRTHNVNTECGDIHRALIKAYTNDPVDGQHLYVFTDPERWLKEEQVERRVMNLIHQLHQDDKVAKVLIFVSSRLALPHRLRRYVEVVHDRGLDETQTQELIQQVGSKLKATNAEARGLARHFAGLTSYEIDAAITQSVVKTRRDEGNPRRIDPKLIGEYKRTQLQKSDLLTFVDTSHSDFNQLGGLDQFKQWAVDNKPCWTEEGRKFGLETPKGVLCVGVWGCGKSEATKALGNCWNLPVTQLEMGRLRSSGVGETEANIYRAIAMIEAVSPCILWVDEGEKTMSGGHSSSYSDAGTTSRTLGILSTWFQETKAQVCMAMTANSFRTLPVEFINRIEERFFFDLPSEEERMEIIKIHLRRKNQDPSKYQIAELAEASKNMVGREIWQAIKAALRTSFNAGADGLDEKILLEELRRKPRIFRTMVDELKEVLTWVGYDPEADDGIRARFASKKRSETFNEFRVAKVE
jgi:SpoVK/Ycf46/Vps4 family AAA+-type ATPase